jgi:hypothetical protein
LRPKSSCASTPRGRFFSCRANSWSHSSPPHHQTSAWTTWITTVSYKTWSVSLKYLSDLPQPFSSSESAPYHQCTTRWWSDRSIRQPHIAQLNSWKSGLFRVAPVVQRPFPEYRRLLSLAVGSDACDSELCVCDPGQPLGRLTVRFCALVGSVRRHGARVSDFSAPVGLVGFQFFAVHGE